MRQPSSPSVCIRHSSRKVVHSADDDVTCQTVDRRQGTGYCRICGNVGCHLSSSGWYNPTYWIERQQRLFRYVQLTPVDLKKERRILFCPRVRGHRCVRSARWGYEIRPLTAARIYSFQRSPLRNDLNPDPRLECSVRFIEMFQQ